MWAGEANSALKKPALLIYNCCLNSANMWALLGRDVSCAMQRAKLARLVLDKSRAWLIVTTLLADPVSLMSLHACINKSLLVRVT